MALQASAPVLPFVISSAERLPIHGMQDLISERHGSRNPTQCRERYYNCIAPAMVEAGIWDKSEFRLGAVPCRAVLTPTCRAEDDRRLVETLWVNAFITEEQVPWDDIIEGRDGKTTHRRWRLICEQARCATSGKSGQIGRPDRTASLNQVVGKGWRDKSLEDLLLEIVDKKVPQLKEVPRGEGIDNVEGEA